MLIETIDRAKALKYLSKWYSKPKLKYKYVDSPCVSARYLTRKQYIFHDNNGRIAAIDNSRGFCEVEDFATLEEATNWLRREIPFDAIAKKNSAPAEA